MVIARIGDKLVIPGILYHRSMIASRGWGLPSAPPGLRIEKGEDVRVLALLFGVRRVLCEAQPYYFFLTLFI
jgi:hypothetical protein